MRTRRRRLAPPTDANELLAALRGARLLPPKQLRRLALSWSESRPDEPDDPLEGTRCRAHELADAGLLTPWQVERVLAGEAKRLRLGQYRLLDWLGAGGMGSVYKAEHRLMKRVVALKVLCDPPQSTSAVDLGLRSPALSVGRSRREVEAAARLSHPNIVTAHDAVRTRGVFFLVMEYVEGIDLGRLISQAGPMPVALACEAILQIARALQYAHEHGLLHCDVKPANLVLVHPPRPSWDADSMARLVDSSAPLFKLLDMGLARRMDAPGGPAEDDLEGTPDYMAPERGSGESIDGRSDLYSLGCTFYHLLTGQPPFPGGDMAAKVLRHRLDAPAPLHGLRPDAPADVAAVIERLTARDAADRYPTAAEAAEALEAVGRSLREQPVDAPAAAEPAPPRPLAERAAYRFPSLVLAAALCGGLFGGAARLARTPPKEAPPPSISYSLPFIIEGRPGGFSSLSEALAAADDGAVVTLHGAGPYPTPPLSCRGRSLTLRAAPDSRPCLEMTPSSADPWRTLLTADRDLTLEGLDLRAPPDPAGRNTSGRLICCERAALRLTDCRLSAPCGAGIVLRNGGELSLQGCRVETGGTAVSVEVGGQKTCAVRIGNTTLDVREPGGAALALWAPGVSLPTVVEVELTGDTIAAARATALTALPAGLRVTARGNDFSFRDALLSCAGYSDKQGWKGAATWAGGDNRYRGSGAWLTIDGTASDVRSLTAWRELWHSDETGSREDAAAGKGR